MSRRAFDQVKANVTEFENNSERGGFLLYIGK